MALTSAALVVPSRSNSGLTFAWASTFCTATEGAGAAEDPVELRPKRPSQPPCRLVEVLIEFDEEGGGAAALVRRAMRAGVADLGTREVSLLVVTEETVRMEAATEEERL